MFNFLVNLELIFFLSNISKKIIVYCNFLGSFVLYSFIYETCIEFYWYKFQYLELTKASNIV